MTHSIVILGATSRIGGILRKLWPQEWPVTWVARAIPEDAADTGHSWAACDPLQNHSAGSKHPGSGHPGPEHLCAILERAQPSVVLSLAGTVPRATMTATAQAAVLADHTALAEALLSAARMFQDRTGRSLPVVLSSSAAIYGRLAAQDPRRGLHEADPLPPRASLSPYGQAKYDMEAVAAQAVAEGDPVTCLRIANIAGIDAALGGWQRGFTLDVFADGRTPVRSYIGPHQLALSLAHLLLRAACNQQALPAVLNVAAPGAIEMGALLTAAGRAFSTRPAPQGAIASVVLNVQQLQTVLGDPVSSAISTDQASRHASEYGGAEPSTQAPQSAWPPVTSHAPPADTFMGTLMDAPVDTLVADWNAWRD